MTECVLLAPNPLYYAISQFGRYNGMLDIERKTKRNPYQNGGAGWFATEGQRHPKVVLQEQSACGQRGQLPQFLVLHS